MELRRCSSIRTRHLLPTTTSRDVSLAQATFALTVGLFVGMVACLEVGFRIGRVAAAKDPAAAHEGVATMDAAAFALFGLLLGFSFAGATSRLEMRRQQIVQEANAIGTAYLRIDLLPPGEQQPMRQLFGRYLDARLAMYARLPDTGAAERELARAEAIQHEIWSRAVNAGRTDATQNTVRMLLPSLNDMIDITTTRAIALRTHLPPVVLALLTTFALMIGVLAGHAMAKRRHRSWLHLVLYS